MRGRPIEKIRKLIPQELRELLAKEFGGDLSVQKNVSPPSTELHTAIDAFVLAYNLKHKENKLVSIQLTNLKRALFANESDKDIGFSEVTANTLCRYATKGRLDWIGFLEENAKVEEEYKDLGLVGKKDDPSKKSEPASKSAEAIGLELTNYLRKKLKEFESICLPIARQETKIAIKDIIPLRIIPYDYIESSPPVRPPWADEEEEPSAIASENEFEPVERMVIVSEAGTGKTTLCKYLFHLYALKFLSKESTIFPVYVDLTIEQSFIEILTTSNEDAKISANAVNEWLTQFTPFIICDGLDSLKDSNLHLIEEINQKSLFQKCNVLVTSRESERLRFFTSKGYHKYKLSRNSWFDLPRVLLKGEDKESLRKFDKYCNPMLGEYQNYIGTNNLLHTFFILNYLKGGKKVQSQGEILKNILEHYYIENWELAKPGRDKELPESIDRILNPLAVMALVNNYNHNFTDSRNWTTTYRNMQLMTHSGFTYLCLCNFITMSSYGRKKIDPESLITFYCQSGLLVQNPSGTYSFANQIFERYFHARGMIEFCFIQRPFELLPFSWEVADKFIHAFCCRKSEAKEIVASLVREPSKVVRSLYKNPPRWWRLMNYGYVSRLFFASQITSVRKSEIHSTVIDSVREQLIYFLKLVNIKSDPSLTRKFLRYFSMSTGENLMTSLAKLKEEAAFDAIFDYYQFYDAHIDSGMVQFICWEYFMLFPHKKLCDYCLGILKEENYLKNDDRHRRWKLEYLHKFEPLEIIKFYIQILSAPKDFEETFFDTEIGIRANSFSYSKLWEDVEEFSNSDPQISSQLEEVLLHQALNSDNKKVVWLCETLIGKSGRTKTSFLGKIELLMQEAKTNNDIRRLFALLHLYGKTPHFDGGVHDFYVDYILSESKSKQ